MYFTVWVEIPPGIVGALFSKSQFRWLNCKIGGLKDKRNEPLDRGFGHMNPDSVGGSFLTAFERS